MADETPATEPVTSVSDAAPKPTLMQRWEALSAPKKYGAVGTLIALGLGAGWMYGKKKQADADAAAAAAAAAAPPANPPIEANYSLAPSVALNLAHLPVLRPTIGSQAGATYGVTGDETAPFVGSMIDAAAETTGNVNLATQASPESQFIPYLGAVFANMAQKGQAPPPMDMLFVILGPKQEKGNVGALKESIATIRKFLGDKSVLWVLAKSTPVEIAKALNESHEEWVRSAQDDATTMASYAWVAATDKTTDELNQHFPGPTA